jgi:hypothetical protein
MEGAERRGAENRLTLRREDAKGLNHEAHEGAYVPAADGKRLRDQSRNALLVVRGSAVLDRALRKAVRAGNALAERV